MHFNSTYMCMRRQYPYIIAILIQRTCNIYSYIIYIFSNCNKKRNWASAYMHHRYFHTTYIFVFRVIFIKMVHSLLIEKFRYANISQAINSRMKIMILYRLRFRTTDNSIDNLNIIFEEVLDSYCWMSRK